MVELNLQNKMLWHFQPHKQHLRITITINYIFLHFSFDDNPLFTKEISCSREIRINEKITDHSMTREQKFIIIGDNGKVHLRVSKYINHIFHG